MSRAWILSSGQDGKCVVNSDVARRVLGPHKAQPVNLISIFGAARQGKSFLMNCLAGQDGIFRISNSQDPCTQGIDISGTLMTRKQFSQLHGGLPASGANCLVGFVDAEGQGDRDERYDAKLVCPILLCSKSIIFNWKDSLQRDRMLKLLGVMQKAALSVDPSNESSTKIFGHLHIVFRDWQYEGTKESVYNTLFAKERSADHDAIVRNSIRETLLDSFESITIWLFPPPSVDTRRELTFARTSPAFQEAVQALRRRLVEDLSEPTRFHEKPLTARSVPPLVEQIVQLLNSDQAIQPESAYTSMLRAEGSRSRQEYEDQLRDVVKRWEEKCEAEPIEEAAFKASLQQDLGHILGNFRAEIEHLLEADVTHALHNELLQPLEALAADLQAAALLRHAASVQTHLATSRKKAERTVKTEAKALAESLPIDEDELQAKVADLEAQALKAFSRSGRELFGDQAAGSTVYREATRQLKLVVRDAIAKLQQQNAELQQQNENRVGEALKEYDNEFEAYCTTVFNVVPLPRPSELGSHFQNQFATPAQTDFFKRLQDRPKLYDKARGVLEHKLHAFFADLQERFLGVVAATAQSHLKDAINEVTTGAFEITPTQYVPEAQLEAQLAALCEGVRNEQIGQFAPWLDEPANQASELGQQVIACVDEVFDGPLFRHQEALWQKIVEKNQQLYSQPQVKMEISSSKPAKPRSSKAAAAPAAHPEPAAVAGRSSSIRLGLDGAKFTKGSAKSQQPKTVSRPSTPPMEYDDRTEAKPKPSGKGKAAQVAKATKAAKATPTKRRAAVPPSEDESEESYHEESESSEAAPVIAKRKSPATAAASTVAARRSSTPKKRPIKTSSDESEDDEAEEEEEEPMRQSPPKPSAKAPAARRTSTPSNRRKSAPAAGGASAEDVIAAAREEAKAQLQARAAKAAEEALEKPPARAPAKRARR